VLLLRRCPDRYRHEPAREHRGHAVGLGNSPSTFREPISRHHCHSDHVGLVSLLKTATSRVFLHPLDAATICDPNLWRICQGGSRAWLPDPESAVEKHRESSISLPGSRIHPLRDGDTLSVGQYHFRCVETPVTLPGHLCLFEPEAGIFFSGDHILDSITPNISGGPENDPLGDFEASLDKVAAYDIRLVLRAPNPITDHRRRIGN